MLFGEPQGHKEANERADILGEADSDQIIVRLYSDEDAYASKVKRPRHNKEAARSIPYPHAIPLDGDPETESSADVVA